MCRSQVSKTLSNIGKKITNLTLLRLKFITANSFRMEISPTRNIMLSESILLEMCLCLPMP